MTTDQEIARLREELALVKCGEPNHPDRAYAMKGWLKTFGFKVYRELKQGDVGFVLSLLQSGEITRSRAAEAIAELLTGAEPLLPQFEGDVFAEDEMPRETVARLREAVRELREALAMQRNDIAYAWEHRPDERLRFCELQYGLGEIHELDAVLARTADLEADHA